MRFFFYLSQDKLIIPNNLEEQRLENLRKTVVNKIKTAYELSSTAKSIGTLKLILESNFCCTEKLYAEQQSTKNTLEGQELQNDKLFRILRSSAPLPIESWIESLLISQIVNWSNAHTDREVDLKMEFKGQITRIEQVLDLPMERG